MPTYNFSPQNSSSVKQVSRNNVSLPSETVVKYETVAPKFVKKNVIQRNDGGVNLYYHLAHASVRPKLRKTPLRKYIQVTRVISPMLVKLK